MRDVANKSGTLSSIQILRGIAALFIVIGHSQGAARELAALSGQLFIAWRPIPWGVGVDIFFVISGFIIFHASEKYEGRSGAGKSFIAHRIARLVPLYWLCTCAFLALVVVKKSLGFAQSDEIPSGRAIIFSLLFLPFAGSAMPKGLAFPVYDLGWTLNYEMYFYVLFALCLGYSRSQSALRILGILCSIVVLGLIFKPSLLPFSFWCQPIILEFGVGIGIAVALRQGFALALPIRLVVIGLGILLIVLLPFGQPGEFEGTTFNDLVRFFTFGVPAALIVAGAALGPDVKKSIWLSPSIAVGNASYSVYLVHPFIIFGFSVLFRRFGLLNTLELPSFVILVIVFASLASVISYRFFERPSARAVVGWLTREETGRKNQS